jgi:hypothetical protein
MSEYHDDPIDQSPRRRSFLSSFLVFIVLIGGGGFFVKSTLAANISLSSGGSVEFGQAVSQAVACSGGQNLTLIPRSSFVNGSNGTGSHYLSSITVGNIPTSCYGTNFKLSAYGSSSSTPLAIFNTTSTEAVVYNNSGSFEVRDPSDGVTLTGASGTFTVTFDSPVALSTSVFKVTIQSSLGVRALQVGETGPGGGVIFYKAITSFACGPDRAQSCRYLEAAPSGWNTGTDPTRTWAQSSPVDYQYTTVNNATAPQTATAFGIGWGYRNTRAIILQGNNDPATSGAALADAYSPTVGGVVVDDWFLPSVDELHQMCKWVRNQPWTSDGTPCNTSGAINTGPGATGFSASPNYSSSTEAASFSRYNSNLGVGGMSGEGKRFLMSIRPIRAF